MQQLISKMRYCIVIVLFFQAANAQVGINTTTPQSTFEVNGSIGQKISSVSTNTILDDTYNIIVCNNGATPISLTLPSAAASLGRVYVIKKDAASTGNVTVIGAVDSGVNLVLSNPGDFVTVVNTGSDWKTMAKTAPISPAAWSTAGTGGTTAGTNFIGTTDANDFVVKTNNSEALRITSAGNTGLGVTAPTAYLHIKGGTAAAGTAPLKLTDGPLLSVAEPGAIEYKGHTFYATTYLVRRSVMLAQDIVVNPVTVSGTTAETIIYTGTMAANYLTAGKMINTKLFGRFSTNNNSIFYTIRVRLAGVTILTVLGLPQNANGRPFDIDLRSIVRSIGTNGKILSYGKTQQDNLGPNIEIGDLTTIDTTINNSFTITVQWSSPSGSLTLEGGATECVDANN